MKEKCILIVDDDAAVRGMLVVLISSMIEKPCHTASNGRVAFEFMTDHPDAVELVVSDIEMPQMTGIELTKAIRLHFPSIPVLLWSGEIGKWIEEARKAGASQCFEKGIDTVRLVEAAVEIVSPVKKGENP